MSTTTGLMTIEEVSLELNVAPLYVQRLIARGRIKANRIGETGPWRIPVDQVTKYIGQNAPDLTPPEHDRRWFNGRDKRHAEQFPYAIIEAAQDQVLPDADVRRMFQDAPLADSLDVSLKITPAVRAVMNKPIPRSPFDQRPAENPLYRNWLEEYLVWELRHCVREFLEKSVRAIGLLERFYENPEAYAQTLAEGIAKASQRKIAFSRQHLVDNRSTGLRKTVWYILPNNRLLSQGGWDHIEQLAF